MRTLKSGMALVAVVILALLIGGCAGGSKMQRVEEGYMPQYVAVGDIIPYTQGAAGMDASRIRQLVGNQLETAFRDQGIPFVSLREIESTTIPMEQIVRINGSVTFQQGASDIVQSTDARINYDIVRASDGLLWQKGSAKSTDWSVSQGATTDVQSAIGFVAQAVAADLTELLP